MARLQDDSAVFDAIACPTRRALLDELSHGERHVSALVQRLEVTQSAVSQQLAVLKSAGLVDERRDGRFRYYRLRATPLLNVQAWLARHCAQVERQLDALGQVLDLMEDPPATRARRLSRRSR